MSEESDLMAAQDDYWFWQRHDDALWAQREEEGRCGQCGAFDGPNHLCPHIQQLRNQVRRHADEALAACRAMHPDIHPGQTCDEFEDSLVVRETQAHE